MFLFVTFWLEKPLQLTKIYLFNRHRKRHRKYTLESPLRHPKKRIVFELKLSFSKQNINQIERSSFGSIPINTWDDSSFPPTPFAPGTSWTTTGRYQVNLSLTSRKGNCSIVIQTVSSTRLRRDCCTPWRSFRKQGRLCGQRTYP